MPPCSPGSSRLDAARARLVTPGARFPLVRVSLVRAIAVAAGNPHTVVTTVVGGTMRISGEAKIEAPLERVWWALNDPAVLVRAIPGCERLEETGPDAYRMTVTAGVATIRGTYDGEVRITDQVEPTEFTMRASGAGAPGTVRAEVRVQLSDDGGGITRVRYDADAVVGGVLGGVGQRLISRVTRSSFSDFFAGVEDVLTGRAVPIHAAAGERSAREGLGRVRTFASPRSLAGAAPLPEGFGGGAAIGAAGALAGVLVGWLIGRRR